MVCCVITDNANNIVAAVRHNKLNHLPCFAHTVNLLVTNSLQEMREVLAMLQRCKNIMSYFHKSCKAIDKLTAIQSRLNIDNHKADTRCGDLLELIILHAAKNCRTRRSNTHNIMFAKQE